MSGFSRTDGPPLRVIQCFRAPLGGLFRHVRDLTRGLAARGVEVGIVCDRRDLSELEQERLHSIAGDCALGIHRVTMPRLPGPKDLTSALAVARLAARLDADILHGHGAKGGAYARLAAAMSSARAVYTPHGGSLHYTTSRPDHVIFRAVERLLRRFDAAVIFESEFAAQAYAGQIGGALRLSRIVHNGLNRDEFAPVEPAPDAVDILFLGEFRAIKGIASLIAALAIVARQRKVTALLIGTGPDEARLRDWIAAAGLTDRVRIHAPMPAREAFARCRVLAIPSLAESFPYVVLEAGAAGVPQVATRIGGIPEIFGPDAGELVAPGDPAGLADALIAALSDPAAAGVQAERLRNRIAERFTVERMVESILDVYGSVLAPGPSFAAGSLAEPSA